MKWISPFLFLLLTIHCNTTTTTQTPTYSWRLQELYFHDDIRIIQAANSARDHLRKTKQIHFPTDLAYYRGTTSNSDDTFFRIILADKLRNEYRLYSITLQYISHSNPYEYKVLSTDSVTTYNPLSINNIKLFRIHRQLDYFYTLNSKRIKYISEVIEYSSLIESNIYIATVKLMNNITTRVFIIEDGNEYIINGDVIE